MSATRICIVLARLVEDYRVPAGAKIARTDLGERQRLEVYQRPEAMTWLNEGTEEDAEKAKTWAAANGHSVIAYPAPQSDPLNRARKEISGDR